MSGLCVFWNSFVGETSRFDWSCTICERCGILKHWRINCHELNACHVSWLFFWLGYADDDELVCWPDMGRLPWAPSDMWTISIAALLCKWRHLCILEMVESLLHEDSQWFWLTALRDWYLNASSDTYQHLGSGVAWSNSNCMMSSKRRGTRYRPWGITVTVPKQQLHHIGHLLAICFSLVVLFHSHIYSCLLYTSPSPRD